MEINRGVTQGDIDSPIIFNIIVDAVLREWNNLQEGQDRSNSRFYADDGLVENTNKEQLQNDINTIIKLFQKVGLQANEKKTKFMIVRGPKAPKQMSTEVCNNISRRRRGLKPTMSYKEKCSQDVECTICGKQLKGISLPRHMRTLHNEILSEEEEEEDTVFGLFQLNNFTKGHYNKCPVPNCSGGGRDTYAIYNHFASRHPNADIRINGDRDVVKCDSCGQNCRNLEKHKKSAMCKKMTNRRINARKRQIQMAAEKAEFFVNGKKIERVHRFKYLGRWLDDRDDDTYAIVDNIRKARNQWNCLARILKREGANAVCMGRFYLVVVQAVLLYGSDSWTITEGNLKRIRSFHNRAVRYLTGKHICKRNEIWEYPNHQELYKEAGLLPIEKYIERRRGTLRRYLETNRKDLLTKATQCKPHKHHPRKVLWWKQTWVGKQALKVFSNMWFSC